MRTNVLCSWSSDGNANPAIGSPSSAAIGSAVIYACSARVPTACYINGLHISAGPVAQPDRAAVS